jgi:signal peptidase II
LKRYIRDYAILVLVAGVVIGLDQWTKYLVREFVPLTTIWMPAGLEWLTPYARIVHWYNTGVAFGMFQGLGGIFTILAILVALAIVYYYPQIPHEDWMLRAAMGLMLGGALGNLVDRILRGQVTDFISVGNFPVFNIADSGITVGVIIMILGVYIQDLLKKKTEKAAVEAEIQIQAKADKRPLDE